MSNKILEKLDKEIEAIMLTMEDLPANSDEYKQCTEALAKLIDRRNEMVKIEYDHLDKKQSRQEENDLKLKQMEDENKDRKVKNRLTAAKIFGGFAITGLGTLVTLNFERIANVTTIAGREFVKQLFIPKKD